MTHSDQRTPASGLYKSLQILALDNMIRLTLITIAHSFHHKTLPKIFDNVFTYLKHRIVTILEFALIKISLNHQ